MQDSRVKIVLNRNCVTTDPLETETGFMNMSLNRSHGIRHSSDIFAKPCMRDVFGCLQGLGREGYRVALIK